MPFASESFEMTRDYVYAPVLVIEDDSDADSTALVYRAKAAVLNDAIQEIGMGRYQW
jgi:hypothetical protein